MKFTVLGVVTCVASVDVEADTFADAVRIAQEKCLTGTPVDVPDFEVQSVERMYVAEDEVEEVSRRVAENESICSQVESDTEQAEDNTEEDAALERFRKMWVSQRKRDPQQWFRRSGDCKRKSGCKCNRKGILAIDSGPFPVFWNFNMSDFDIEE